MTISKLQALSAGTAGNSTGEDVALSVNSLIDENEKFTQIFLNNITDRGAWAASTDYELNDIWQHTDNTWYLVVTPYTSDSSDIEMDVNSGNVNAYLFAYEDHKDLLNSLVNPIKYGAIRGVDSTAAFQAAVNYANASGILGVLVPFGEWIIHGLEMKSGVKLIALGGHQRQVGGDINGAIFTRTLDVPMITATGISIKDPSPLGVVDLEFHGIRFDGGGETFNADIFDLKVVYTSLFSRCSILQTSGRLIKMTECFDNRFDNCRFEWGGTADGTVPAVELISNGDYEATNQIHFSGCVFEAFRGIALKTTDADGGTGTYRTNEIYFNQTKVEGNASDQPLMLFEKCGGIHFNLLQLTARGTPGNTNEALIKFDRCNNITGHLHAEISPGGADWSAYIRSVLAVEVDFDLSTYGQVISGVSAVSHDGFNTSRFRVNSIGSFTFENTYPNSMGHILSREGDAIIEGSPNKLAALRLRDTARVPGESWYFGKIVEDGLGSKCKFVHNEDEVMRFQNDNKVIVKKTLRCDISMEMTRYTLATLPAAGGLQAQFIYVTDATGGQCPVYSDGINWKKFSDNTIVS